MFDRNELSEWGNKFNHLMMPTFEMQITCKLKFKFYVSAGSDLSTLNGKLMNLREKHSIEKGRKSHMKY